jgi:hypothetical protein
MPRLSFLKVSRPVGLDVLGTLYLIGASALLVYALQEGGISHPWTDAAMMWPLVVSTYLWITFFMRQKRIDVKTDQAFGSAVPWTLVTNRFFASAAL